MAVLLKFCSEGDNIPDAFVLVNYLNEWLQLIKSEVSTVSSKVLAFTFYIHYFHFSSVQMGSFWLLVIKNMPNKIHICIKISLGVSPPEKTNLNTSSFL